MTVFCKMVTETKTKLNPFVLTNPDGAEPQMSQIPFVRQISHFFHKVAPQRTCIDFPDTR